MVGLLGNFRGRVKPWYLPFGNRVYCRVADDNRKTKVIIVENDMLPNVYDLPVRIEDGKVIGVNILRYDKPAT